MHDQCSQGWSIEEVVPKFSCPPFCSPIEMRKNSPSFHPSPWYFWNYLHLKGSQMVKILISDFKKQRQFVYMTFWNFPKVPFLFLYWDSNIANKNKVSRCWGFRLFFCGEKIMPRYKYPFSTDEVLHGADHQNVIKNISYTQTYSMYIPDMLPYALYIGHAPPDMLHWVCYQLCSNLYWKTYKKEELLK